MLLDINVVNNNNSFSVNCSSSISEWIFFMRNNVLKHLNFLHDLIFTVQSCEEYSTVLPSQTFGIIFNNEVMFWIRLVNVRGISNWVSEEILEWIRFAISRSVIGLVKSRYFLTNYMQINRYSFLGFMSSLHWPPLTHTFVLIGYCSR